MNSEAADGCGSGHRLEKSRNWSRARNKDFGNPCPKMGDIHGYPTSAISIGDDQS